MPGGKWNSGVRCIQAFFVLILLALIVVGVVLYLDNSVPGFIGIILIVTAGLVVLSVVFLAVNAYCNRKYSRSFEIHGLTDGLEFDELEERWYGNSSRKPSLQHRHSMYDQDVVIVLDSIPHDVSDDDGDEEGESSNLNNETEYNDSPPSNDNWRNRNSTILEEDEEEEEENMSNDNEQPTLNDAHNSDNDSNNNNNENNPEELALPSYEDAISNYGEDEINGSLPSYQEAVLNEESQEPPIQE